MPYHSHIHDCGSFRMSSYVDCGVRSDKAFRVVRNWARFLRPCAMLFFYDKNFFLFAENFIWPPHGPITLNPCTESASESPEKNGTHISVNPFENMHFYDRFDTRCWNDELMTIRSRQETKHSSWWLWRWSPVKISVLGLSILPKNRIGCSILAPLVLQLHQFVIVLEGHLFWS